MPTVKELARGDGWSFWAIGGEVYRARTGETLDINGQPQAKRWECSVENWRRYRAVFAWAIDTALPRPCVGFCAGFSAKHRAMCGKEVA